MTYLISQLWLYLLCAGLLGLLLGWVVWGWWGRRHLAEARAEYERQRLALERNLETEKAAFQEDVTAAFRARDEALKVKASLLGDLEGERKAAAEAKAQVGRLTQAELAARGEFDRKLASLSALSTSGQGQSHEADRLLRELEEARQHQRGLDAELARLRALLAQRETAGAKAASPKFTTDAPRPASLFDRRPDVDDLKEVKGIGPVMEGHPQ